MSKTRTAPSSTGPIVVEAIGACTMITFNRPDARNALGLALAEQLGEALRAANADASMRAIVLAAEGPVFMAGGDLKELASYGTGEDGARRVLALGEHLAPIAGGDLPVIAAVSGDAFGGGCELLLHCDLVVLESHAKLCFRHARMGLTPAWNGVAQLLDRCGPLAGASLLLTGEPVDAAEALRLGLVSHVVETGRSKERALEIARTIAESGRESIAALKASIREIAELRWGRAPDRERERFITRWGSPDHLRAMQAFAARRGGRGSEG